MGLSDFSSSCIIGLWSPTFPMRPTPPSVVGDEEISRFSRKKVPHVQRVYDRAGSACTSR
jgi:hypothetical protein